MLRDWPSGDLFGLSQNAGMGWPPQEMLGPQMLLLSTQGGVRAEDGTPIALGYHTGHWEVGLLVQEAARTLKRAGAVPFAAYCSDPCDGRTQGTPGMFDSLPYRNDAAMLLRRLIRSLPARRGVLGVATCDKGLPAMMMALAGMKQLPAVLVPGGVSLPPEQGEDAGKVQSLGARYCAWRSQFGRGRGTELPGLCFARRRLPVFGHGRDFASDRRSARHDGSPCGARAERPADLARPGSPQRDGFIGNAQRRPHAGRRADRCGGAQCDDRSCGLRRFDESAAASSRRSRMPPDCERRRSMTGTRSIFARRASSTRCRMVRWGIRPCACFSPAACRKSCCNCASWICWIWKRRPWPAARLPRCSTPGEQSPRRKLLHDRLREADGVEPQRCDHEPGAGSRARPDADGLLSARQSGARRLDRQKHGHRSALGRSRRRLSQARPARVFTRERDAIDAIKGRRGEPIRPGDVIVLAGRGPLGSGMEETYQITSALKHLDWGRDVAVVTDARFSGVSTGACIGHVGPEALAGGPIGKVQDGDRIQIIVDCKRLTGSVDLVGDRERMFEPGEADRVLAARPMREQHQARRPLARRHSAVGGAASRQRRSVGGLRLRCRADHSAAGGRPKPREGG